MKQVIILERDTTTAQVRFRFAMWAAVPTARQPMLANANATSAYKNISAQELLDMQAGKVIERVDNVSFDQGTPLATVQNALQAMWTSYQADVNNNNSWNRYGTFWDGASWTAGGLA